MTSVTSAGCPSVSAKGLKMVKMIEATPGDCQPHHKQTGGADNRALLHFKSASTMDQLSDTAGLELLEMIDVPGSPANLEEQQRAA